MEQELKNIDNYLEKVIDHEALDKFTEAMKRKLDYSRNNGKNGWHDETLCSVEFLQKLLIDHIEKGDPVDVANLCMMLWNRGHGTIPTNDLTFEDLRLANLEREKEWPGAENIDREFRAIEFSGESGELMEAIKKYLRAERGIKGSTATKQEIADEMGDVIIALNLLASEFDISLGEVVREKFNKTSSKYNLKTKL